MFEMFEWLDGGGPTGSKIEFGHGLFTYHNTF